MRLAKTLKVNTIKKPTKTTVFFLGLMLLPLCYMFIVKSLLKTETPESPPPAELEGVLRPEPKALQAFVLTDHNNTHFNEERLKNKWSFVFFGYTSCPDICPATLSVLTSVQVMLANETGKTSDDIQVVFISVDPKRDTPELLSSYIAHFNKKFIGATASKKEINKIVQQFGAGYEFEPKNSAGQYTIAHTSAIFLIDPLGKLVATFSQPHYPATIAKQYQKVRTYLQTKRR